MNNVLKLISSTDKYVIRFFFKQWSNFMQLKEEMEIHKFEENQQKLYILYKKTSGKV